MTQLVDIPVVDAWSSDETRVQDMLEALPIVELDCEFSHEAARAMFEITARSIEGYEYVIVCRPLLVEWTLLGGAAPPPPQVTFTISSKVERPGCHGSPSISFSMPVDAFGDFMQVATTATLIGVTPAPPIATSVGEEQPSGFAVLCENEPMGVAAAELQAWRHSYAADRPGAYQPALLLE